MFLSSLQETSETSITGRGHSKVLVHPLYDDFALSQNLMARLKSIQSSAFSSSNEYIIPESDFLN